MRFTWSHQSLSPSRRQRSAISREAEPCCAAMEGKVKDLLREPKKAVRCPQVWIFSPRTFPKGAFWGFALTGWTTSSTGSIALWGFVIWRNLATPARSLACVCFCSWHLSYKYGLQNCLGQVVAEFVCEWNYLKSSELSPGPHYTLTFGLSSIYPFQQLRNISFKEYLLLPPPKCLLLWKTTL